MNEVFQRPPSMEGNRSVQKSLIKHYHQLVNDREKVIVLNKCDRLPDFVSERNNTITASQNLSSLLVK